MRCGLQHACYCQQAIGGHPQNLSLLIVGASVASRLLARRVSRQCCIPERPLPHKRAGSFYSIRCLEAWRCGSIYCGGDHLGSQYPSHHNDGATHDKDENEKRHSSDDELHWLHNKPPGRRYLNGESAKV